MARSHRTHSLFALLSAASFAAACSISGPPEGFDNGEGGSDGGDDGSPATGAQSSSHATASSGSGMPVEPKCPYEGTPIDPASLGAAACPASLCGGGAHCLPTALVAQQYDDPAELEKLADCDAKNKCVPDFFIANQGLFIPTTCDSVLGAEGRCLSECLPDVAKQMDVLPAEGCGAFERCVPCFDPLTQKETGACKLSCDPGPTEPPMALPKCCSGIGTCVPGNAVPGEQADKLGGDSCPQDQGLLCAPDVFINNQNYQPAACETKTLSLLFGSDYKPGVCLPGCLPDVAGALFIGQDGCPEHFKCAPCLKPGLFGPKETGACDL
ncbi:MAG: hypothetical protein EXR75_09260 [Myxococcales bacterium]|nr:hypothetical protein [Myxococcales bacterium]